MPGKRAKTLNAGSGLTEPASVFDFLYYDAARVGAFLAQLDPDGRLTGVTKTGQINEASSTKSLIEGAGGVPGVANAKASSEEQTQEGTVATAARSYDPFWAAPLAFLDYAHQRELLHANLSEAGVGQFVIARGRFSIIDMLALKSAWEAPTIRKSILAGVRPDTTGMSKAQAQAAKQAQIDNTNLALEMITMMPHGLQGQLVSSDELLWMSLEPAGLTTSPGDISLKHGVTLAGQWHVVGILDAVPDEGPSLELANSLASVDLVTVAEALSSTPIGIFAQALSPMTRIFMGRPAQAYGISPLLVFRELRARGS